MLFQIVWEEIPAAQHPNLVVKEREIVTIKVNVLVTWCVDLTIVREKGLTKQMIVAW